MFNLYEIRIIHMHFYFKYYITIIIQLRLSNLNCHCLQLFHLSIIFYSIEFYSFLFYSILLDSFLFFSILFYSIEHLTKSKIFWINWEELSCFSLFCKKVNFSFESSKLQIIHLTTVKRHSLGKFIQSCKQIRL